MNHGEFFDYRDGQLFWKAVRPLSHFRSKRGLRIWMTRYSGRLAGTHNGGGYVQVMLDGRIYFAHRVIWEMHHGPIPKGIEIDHVNMNRSDNRIENLRSATRSQNRHNTKRKSNNTSGYKGVSWCKKRNMWMARIAANKKNRFLGYFKTAEDAYKAYCAAAANLHGVFNRTE